ncbi:hypothetical protein QYE76_050970 [Lolium multiflorum]|uniref:Transposase (putative) gypsy type domain-containing protein n=1 Tax=Lolium multiflorum TaxID=4521 RepID=A0AAD8SSK9_LOLMU|nr:hypothetical protein QYE76_050970 [Lolium multiflorum]
MGKKKGASTSGAAKVSRDWSASAISNRDINKLRALGFISASEDDIRLPGAVSRPKPPKGFTVMFTAFLFRGLSLPAHEFLRSLLFFYGIQLWQLTPNSILHLSIFITVCEAFLGIDPHWGLWRKIFYVKRHNDSNGPPVVGGVGFVVRKEVDYLDYPMKESVQGWRNKWFYLRDPSVLEANRLATDAKNENVLLKEEVKKLKQRLKDEQDARRAAAAVIDKKEGVLRESIKDLLYAADITVTRRDQLREDSTADALSLAAESNVQVLGLLKKAKGALSRLYSMIFPKMKQDKTLDEMAASFLVDPSEPVEVLKRRSRLFGAVLTFQLLMGHGMGSELEKLSKALPVDDDNHLVNLEPFKRSAVTCANQLLTLVDEAQAKPTPESAPGSSSASL